MSAPFELHPQLAKDSIWLADWPLCQVRLINDQNYPWFLLVPRRIGARDIIDLTDDDQMLLWQESRKLSLWLRQQFQPEKLNVAALGNLVPQLHLHHIARFSYDAAWPAPVWGRQPAAPYPVSDIKQFQHQWAEEFYVS